MSILIFSYVGTSLTVLIFFLALTYQDPWTRPKKLTHHAACVWVGLAIGALWPFVLLWALLRRRHREDT